MAVQQHDYCNSVLAGVSDVYLQRLQSVQNAAARLVSGAHIYILYPVRNTSPLATPLYP